MSPISSSYFCETAQNYNLEVPSLLCPVFMDSLFLDRANYKELVWDCLDAMKVMGAKVSFF